MPAIDNQPLSLSKKSLFLNTFELTKDCSTTLKVNFIFTRSKTNMKELEEH